MNWGMVTHQVPVERLVLDVIGKAIHSLSVDDFIAQYEEGQDESGN